MGKRGCDWLAILEHVYRIFLRRFNKTTAVRLSLLH